VHYNRTLTNSTKEKKTETTVTDPRPSITNRTANPGSRAFEHFNCANDLFGSWIGRRHHSRQTDPHTHTLSSSPSLSSHLFLRRPLPASGKMMMTRAPMGPMDGAAVDEVARRLVEGGRGGRQVQLSEAEIRQLCVDGKRVLLSQPNLLRIHAPVKICGKSTTFSRRGGRRHLISVSIFVWAPNPRRLASLIASGSSSGGNDELSRVPFSDLERERGVVTSWWDSVQLGAELS
jgi:hypothetical protein